MFMQDEKQFRHRQVVFEVPSKVLQQVFSRDL